MSWGVLGLERDGLEQGATPILAHDHEKPHALVGARQGNCGRGRTGRKGAEKGRGENGEEGQKRAKRREGKGRKGDWEGRRKTMKWKGVEGKGRQGPRARTARERGGREKMPRKGEASEEGGQGPRRPDK